MPVQRGPAYTKPMTTNVRSPINLAERSNNKRVNRRGQSGEFTRRGETADRVGRRKVRLATDRQIASGERSIRQGAAQGRFKRPAGEN